MTNKPQKNARVRAEIKNYPEQEKRKLMAKLALEGKTLSWLLREAVESYMKET